MLTKLYQDIKENLETIEAINRIEWYLNQDTTQGGITITPIVLIRFENAKVHPLSKYAHQIEVDVELRFISDGKKDAKDLAKEQNQHFLIEEAIQVAMTNYDLTGFQPMQKSAGLLKSSFVYQLNATLRKPQKAKTVLSTANITPVVEGTLDIGS